MPFVDSTMKSKGGKVRWLSKLTFSKQNSQQLLGLLTTSEALPASVELV